MKKVVNHLVKCRCWLAMVAILLVAMVLAPQYVLARSSLTAVVDRLEANGGLPIGHGAYHYFDRLNRAERMEQARVSIRDGIVNAISWAHEEGSVYFLDAEGGKGEYGLVCFADALEMLLREADFEIDRDRLYVNLKIGQGDLGLSPGAVIRADSRSSKPQQWHGLVSHAADEVLRLVALMGLDRYAGVDALPDMIMFHADFFESKVEQVAFFTDLLQELERRTGCTIIAESSSIEFGQSNMWHLDGLRKLYDAVDAWEVESGIRVPLAAIQVETNLSLVAHTPVRQIAELLQSKGTVWQGIGVMGGQSGQAGRRRKPAYVAVDVIAKGELCSGVTEQNPVSANGLLTLDSLFKANFPELRCVWIVESKRTDRPVANMCLKRDAQAAAHYCAGSEVPYLTYGRPLDWSPYKIETMGYEPAQYLGMGLLVAREEPMIYAPMSAEESKKLFDYAIAHLYDASTLVTRNESGFIRISIGQVFGEPYKLRFHIWSKENKPLDNKDIEAIHSHPTYFESFVLNGSYTHQLYEESADAKAQFTVCNVSRDAGGVNYDRRTGLTALELQTVRPGDHISFPTTLIHHLTSAEKDTVTLNVLFQDRRSPLHDFNVYMSERGGPDDFIPNKVFVQEPERSECIQRLVEILANTK